MPDPGVRGRAFGLGCPTNGSLRPCVHDPVVRDVRVYDDEGELVATVRSSPDGRFLIRLEPGTYLLDSAPEELPRVEPERVTVRDHEFTEVTMQFG